ncbi:MAG: hypothetical protein J0L66_02910 [Cytophagales bacterium]|nr:hypothetical protein [Cytophagales bacterium]
MKNITNKITALFLPCLLLAGCGGSSKKDSETIKLGDMEIKANEITSADGTKGFKGDIDNTNLQTVYEGLTAEKILLVDGNDKKINGEEIPINSKFSIVYEGIKNYKLTNGKAFPKLSMMLMGETGVVVAEDDLLASYTEGMSAEDAAVLRATFNVGEPMQIGKTYTCQVSVTDKNNKDGFIQTTWLFTVK